MTDNEVIWCFQNGCSLLGNDDIDNSDISQIRRELEKCAENMLPIIHRCITHKDCQECKEKNKNGYCKHREEKCYYTIDRPFFKKLKEL